MSEPLTRDAWAVCDCGRQFYGVAGRPRECPACRRRREGEPPSVAERILAARQAPTQLGLGEKR